MSKFQTKTTTVEAFQFINDNKAPQGVILDGKKFVLANNKSIEVMVGDWVVTEPTGNILALSNATFVDLYEPVLSEETVPF